MSDGLKSSTPGAYRPTQTTQEQGFGDPAFYWCNRVPTTDDRMFSGWATEIGREGQEDFDRALQADGVQRMTLDHGDKKKLSWVFPEIRLHVICLGIPNRPDFRQPPTTNTRLGIRYWYGANDRGGREISHLQFRAVIGGSSWIQPCLFQVAAKTKTEALLAALYEHYRTLDALDETRGQAHPYFMVALPIVAGEKVEARSSKAKGQSSQVVPPVAAIPEVITPEFLKYVWIGNQQRLAVCDGELGRTVEWSALPDPEPRDTNAVAEDA